MKRYNFHIEHRIEDVKAPITANTSYTLKIIRVFLISLS